MNRWMLLIKQLKEHKDCPYTGADNDLDAVKAFIAEHFDSIEGADGKPVDVEAEYKSAYPPKPKFSIAKAEADDEFDRKVNERVSAVMNAAGIKAVAKAHIHDTTVVVGDERAKLDRKGGFKSLGHFIQAVHQVGGTGDRAFEPNPETALGKWHKMYGATVREEAEFAFKSGIISKATLSTYGSEGVGADGGFAVPPEFRAGIMSRIGGEESIQALCAKATLSGNSVTAAIDDTAPWDSSGGIQAYWIGETTAVTQSKPLLKQRDFRLRKIGVLVPMSDELTQDAGFLESYVARVAGDKISYAVDNAILNGNGVTRPTGVVGHNGTVSVAKESSQTATTIRANNVQKMWMAMPPMLRKSATWIINPDCQVQLQRMFVQGVTDAGTAISGGSLVYLPANGLLNASPNDTMMGRPIIYHQACQTLGTVGDIVLFHGDSYLLCTKASGVEAASSIHLWFDQAVNALRFLYRVEGQPWWATTITAANGSQTYGSFVTLATRS
jgi:HK97 family phage major capsid protein